MLNVDALSSSGKFLYYATIGADTDLVAAGGGGACRAVRAQVAGNINVISAAGDTVLLPFLAGETQQVECNKLLTASTTATGITIYW